MIKRPGLIRGFTKRIDTAVRAVALRYGSAIADEDDFTSRLLERIEATLDGWSQSGITLRVRKLTSRGPGAEETEFGADIVATVNVDLKEYQVDKGILVQAKRLDVRQRFSGREWGRLGEQIARMQAHTDQSYVWFYSASGVRSIRSTEWRGAQSRRPDDLYLTKCATFFGEFVQCKHGDNRINGFDHETLSGLRDQYAAKSAISFSFRDRGNHD